MKKRALILMICIVLIETMGIGCVAESNALGDCFRVGGSYTVNYDQDADIYFILGQDGTVFFAKLFSMSEIGTSGQFMKQAIPSLKGISKDGVAFGNTTFEVNGFSCISMSAQFKGLTYQGVMAVHDEALLYLYFFSTMADLDSCRRLFSFVEPLNRVKAEKQKDVMPAYSPDSVVGFYDSEILGERDTDITLILSPGGHGRLSNSTSSITFDYQYKNGQFLLDTNDYTLAPKAEGIVLLQSSYMDITFVKRTPVTGKQSIVGRWKATGMSSNGMTYSQGMLSVLGLDIEFSAYQDGTIDWHAISDRESYLAQGWGVDSKGLYIYNGLPNSCKLNGEKLTVSFDDSKQIVFSWVGPLSGNNAVQPTAAPASPSSAKIPLISDYITTPMLSWENLNYCILLKYDKMLDMNEVENYIDAVSASGSFRLVSNATRNSWEESQVITMLYNFTYEGPGEVSTISPSILWSPGTSWLKGSAETPFNLCFYVVWNARRNICTISIYKAEQLRYDSSEAQRVGSSIR